MAARAARYTALLLPLLFACAALAAQEDRPWERAGTFVADPPVQGVDGLTQSCPAPPTGSCDYNYPVLGESCEVKEARDLGRFGDDQYLVIRYLRETTFDEGAAYGPFNCGSDEIVLAALSGGGQARIVWRDATERTFVFISSARLIGTASGESVLSVLYCMNGTGGCAQGMLIWSGGAWRKLERDDSWQAVYRNLPAGYRQHKSPEIDLGNLTWEQHLAHRDDANCCPSGRIEFRLAIVDGKLAVKSYRIVVPEPEATKETVDRLMATNASELDGRLPAEPFDAWFDGLLPEGAGRRLEIAGCGARGAGSAPAPADPLLSCIAVDVDIHSRDRRVWLLFDRQNFLYRGGEMSSPDADDVLAVLSLAELPRLLKTAMRMRPLACPQGTTLKLKENNAGQREWCEDGRGKRQGPYRSWFATGLYLMEKGRYRNDAKSGEWIECSRFENCVFKSYAGGRAR